MANHRVYLGDARNLDFLLPESVHLVATSPPYWQLKDYGHSGQIGFGESCADYINNLNLVWLGCYRALAPGCRMCINIGDQFARSVVYGRYKVVSIQSEIIRFCETIGMDYMGTIIWQKVTTTNTTGGATIMGSFPYPRNGIVKIDYEHILLFKKQGKPPKPTVAQKAQSRLTTDEWNAYFAGHWNFPGERQNSHLAPFPVELPRRLIRMFTFWGETVLDPFVGSGTTTVAAHELGRNSIGVELNPECEPVIRDRLNGGLFDQPPDVQFAKIESSLDREEKFARLPYLYEDPHTMDAQIDPRSLRFGSRVSQKDRKGDRSYVVVDVIENGELRLDSGLVVRPRFSNGQREALLDLVGKRVALKFPPGRKPKSGSLTATVYLE